MKKPQLNGWPIFILAIGFYTNPGCYGTPREMASTKEPSTSDRLPTGNTTENVFAQDSGEHFNGFDWDLYKVMVTKYHGNLLISPLSVKFTLMLLYEGTDDEIIARALAQAMRLPVGRWASRGKFSLILRSILPSSDEYKLNIGTRMYVASDVKPKVSYAGIIKTFYDTDLVSTNFTNARDAASTINNWVSNVTHRNIEKMIEDEESIKQSVLIIVNALYFKGSWQNNVFLPQATTTGTFFENSKRSYDVTFMNSVGTFWYVHSRELNAKILRIPYVGQKFSMYFVLPDTINGLDRLIEKIDSGIISRELLRMESLSVDVTIPKFKFDFTSHLKPALRALGLNDIFNETSITGITDFSDSRVPFVSEIIQKSGIDVSEEGTTAYAATEVEIGNKMMGEEFTANHPFLFYIQDEITESIIYMGRVTNPLEKFGTTDSESSPDVRSMSIHAPPVPRTPAPLTSNVERNDLFNAEFLQAVDTEIDGNAVISPFSVKAALMAILEGTGGKTRQELASALKLPLDEASIRRIAGDFLKPYSEPQTSTELSLATGLFVDNGSEVYARYVAVVRNYYNGDAGYVRFYDSTHAAFVINQWVRQKTRDHIRSIVEPATLTRNAQLLLISALYFAGAWSKPFDKSNTQPQCFWMADGKCQRVPMMKNRDNYRYARLSSLNAEVVEIPYADDRFSMLVFLPHNAGLQSLQTLKKNLFRTSISTIIDVLRETKIILRLPRFTIETRLDLVLALKNMGIKDLFDSNANFTKISGNLKGRLGSVSHIARIEVDEVGTVAAAVTELELDLHMITKLLEFNVNRPFIFTIIHRVSGSIMFTGHVVQPSVITAPRARKI